MPAKIIAEKVGHRINSAGRLAGDVRRDQQAWRPPEPALRRRRFDGRHIDRGGIEVAALQGVDQCVFVDQFAAGHVDEDCTSFHSRDCGGVDDAAGLGRERRTEKEDVGLREDGGEGLRATEPFDSGRLADGKVVGGNDPHAEGREHLHQPTAHASQAHDADRRVGQVAGGASDKLLPLLLLQKQGNPSRAGDGQPKAVLGHLVGEHPRGARDDDVRADHHRHQTVVESGGRRLDPAEPARLDDAVPGHRHLGVAAEDVGSGQFGSHPLLAGIDDFGMGGHRLNLGDVMGLDGIAEDDAHTYGFRRNGLKCASRYRSTGVAFVPLLAEAGCRGLIHLAG